MLYNELEKEIEIPAGFPVGATLFFAGTIDSIPEKYFHCNGASLNKSTYPELFEAIGYTYGGSGDYFNLPDIRGKFIRSLDNGAGIDPGRVLGSVQQHAIQSHEHANKEYGYGSVNGSSPTTNIVTHPTWPGYVGAAPNIVGEAINANTATETRPVNIALLRIIRYE